MTDLAARRRPGALSIVMIVTSIAASVAISLAVDAVLLRFATPGPVEIVNEALFNLTCVLQSLVGGIIEWRRPGHTMGRLMMLSGPLYAFIASGWVTSDMKPVFDPQVYRLVNWVGAMLSYPVVALIVGWVPLLFPTGTLPGPRWRVPVGVLVVLSGIGVAAWAVRPGPVATGIGVVSPIGIDGWPSFLQPFVDAIPLELLALIGLAVTALITRYRRGDRIERLQIRWFVAAVAVCAVGFAGVTVERAVRTDDGPLVSALVSYAGILAMPIAIGIAVLRYRLFEIDRIISRTLAYAVLTVILVGVYAAGFLLLQTVLASFMRGGGPVAVAGSTLAVFALFQPLRRRVQAAMDRRFNRSRYDAQRTVEGFAARLRDEVDLERVGGELRMVVGRNLAPTSVGVWLRPTSGSKR